MNISAYIFDYGGTLDTAGCHWGKKLWHAYERHGMPIGEEAFREAYVYGERTLGSQPIIKPNFTFRQTLSKKIRLEMEYLCMKGYWNADIDEIRRQHSAILDDLYADTQRITAYSSAILHELRKRYPMVLVSNFYGNIETVLQEFGLSDLFLTIIESAQVGIRKPDPRIFLLGVDALGKKPEECCVVGDSFYKDIEPAKRAGCHAVWFKGEGWTEQKYDESFPDKVITDLRELE